MADPVDADAGGGFLDRIDSLDVINLISWRYDRVAARLAERLGIVPPRAVYAVVGGETPTTKIHEAALRIMNGNSVVAVITGGSVKGAMPSNWKTCAQGASRHQHHGYAARRLLPHPLPL